MSKISVAAVSYLNTKPLLYGIRQHPVMQQIELIEDYPSNIARMLIEGKVDLGLIPVAATLRLNNWHIVSDYCIGADGPVASVCIFSQVPMEEIETLYLDYQSRTSVNLAKILLKEYWRKDVQLVETTGEDFRNKIAGNTAAVVIGDRALQQRSRSKYIYDLAAAWKAHTGLPFVFAAWIANKPLPADFELAFNAANAMGLQQRPVVIAQNQVPYYSLEQYYFQDISYPLDAAKRAGMELFLKKLLSFQRA